MLGTMKVPFATQSGGVRGTTTRSVGQKGWLLGMIQITGIEDIYLKRFSTSMKVTSSLVLVGGVSGAGKTTVCDELREIHPAWNIVRTTTVRERHQGGDDEYYLHCTQGQFEGLMAEDKLYCCMKWPGNNKFYGLQNDELSKGSPGDTLLLGSTHFSLLLKMYGGTSGRLAWLICEDEAEHRHRIFNRNTVTAELQRRYDCAVYEQEYVLRQEREPGGRRLADTVIDTSHKTAKETAREIIRKLNLL